MDHAEGFRKFQLSRQVMLASEFGRLIGDAAWEDEKETQFLVYEDSWWIEICADGRHMLTLENHQWITGDDLSLSDLERKLYEFAVDS